MVYLKAWKSRRLELLRHVTDMTDMTDTWLGNATGLLFHIPLFTFEHFLTNSTLAERKRTKYINATGKGKISGSKNTTNLAFNKPHS